MRDIVLDTYYGEGPLDTTAEDWPGFKHIYFKVCEGAYGFLDGDTLTREVTRQIALESVASGMDTIGIYHYPRRNDYVHWRKQAEAYLRQCDILDSMGVPVDYDVQDVERRNIVGNDGKFPRGHGSALYEMWKFITERTLRPMFRYHDPYTYDECFSWYGYRWQDELPWICAWYPQKPFDEVYWNRAVKGYADPYTRHVPGYPVMWQVFDTYPAGDWFPQSQAADVNVWLVDWRELLGKEKKVEKPSAIERVRAWIRTKTKWRPV